MQACEISDGAKITYAMKKKLCQKNEFIYNCKNPTIKNDEATQFDAFVFSVKIEDCLKYEDIKNEKAVCCNKKM